MDPELHDRLERLSADVYELGEKFRVLILAIQGVTAVQKIILTELEKRDA